MVKQTESQAGGAIRRGLSPSFHVPGTLMGITWLLGLGISQSELPYWNVAPRQVTEPRVGTSQQYLDAGEGCRLER